MTDDEVERLAAYASAGAARMGTRDPDQYLSGMSVLDGVTIAAALRSLKAEREALRAALNEARLQVEYLHGKFVATGSGNAVLARINAALDTAP